LINQQYILGDFSLEILAWDLSFCTGKHTRGLDFTCVLRVLGQEQHSTCSDSKAVEVFSHPVSSSKVQGRSGGFSSDYSPARTLWLHRHQISI